MAVSNTSICNQSLARIGAVRINNFEDADEKSTQMIQCRLHFVPTRDALIQAYFPRFARARATLSQDTTDPDFEWDNQFILPNDYLRFMSIDEENGVTSRHRRHSIEGQRFLTNFSAVNMRYIRKVTDAAQFDPLFVQVLVLQLALKFVPALAKTDPKLQDDIKKELRVLMPKLQAVNMDETDTGGRSDWNLVRHGGIGVTSTDERFW